jgi:hypothetical protein
VDPFRGGDICAGSELMSVEGYSTICISKSRYPCSRSIVFSTYFINPLNRIGYLWHEQPRDLHPSKRLLAEFGWRSIGTGRELAPGEKSSHARAQPMTGQSQQAGSRQPERAGVPKDAIMPIERGKMTLRFLPRDSDNKGYLWGAASCASHSGSRHVFMAASPVRTVAPR